MHNRFSETDPLSLSFSPHLTTGPLADSTPLLLVHPSGLEAAGLAPNWGQREAQIAEKVLAMASRCGLTVGP